VEEVRDLVKSEALEDATPARKCTALSVAAENGHVGVVSLLVEAMANVDCKSSSRQVPAIQLAATYGHAATVAVLVAAGARVNAADELGVTALHAAAGIGATDVVRHLLEGKADVHMKTTGWVSGMAPGATALHYVSMTGHVEVAAALLRARADPHLRVQRPWGATPLHLATVCSAPEPIVRVLVHGRADVNEQTVSWPVPCTPLHLAAIYNNPAAAKALLEASADSSKRTTSVFWFNSTACDVAERYDRRAVLAVLESGGCD
jgi:ankyrin repeat protein